MLEQSSLSTATCSTCANWYKGLSQYMPHRPISPWLTLFMAFRRWWSLSHWPSCPTSTGTSFWSFINCSLDLSPCLCPSLYLIMQQVTWWPMHVSEVPDNSITLRVPFHDFGPPAWDQSFKWVCRATSLFVTLLQTITRTRNMRQRTTRRSWKHTRP